MSPYHCKLSLWKEYCAYMSAMGNRRTYSFEEVNGKVWVDWIKSIPQIWWRRCAFNHKPLHSVTIRKKKACYCSSKSTHQASAVARVKKCYISLVNVMSKALTLTIQAATAGQIWNCSACGMLNIFCKMHCMQYPCKWMDTASSIQ